MAKFHRLVRLGGKATMTTVYLLYFFVVINGTVMKKINMITIVSILGDGSP
jgi:hypothetical protein